MLASRRGKSLVPEALSPPKAAPALAASAPAGSIFAGVKHGGGAHTSHGHGLAPQMDTLNQAPQNPQLLRIMRGSPMVGSIGPSADSNKPPETEKSWTVKEEDAARLGVALFGENWGEHFEQHPFFDCAWWSFSRRACGPLEAHLAPPPSPRGLRYPDIGRRATFITITQRRTCTCTAPCVRTARSQLCHGCWQLSTTGRVCSRCGSCWSKITMAAFAA